VNGRSSGGTAPHPAPRPAPHVLHLRCRALPSTLALLAGAAAGAAAALRWLMVQPGGEASARAVVTVGFPVLAAAAIGVSLHSLCPDADRSASRRWWTLRAGHLIAMTVLAATLLATAVPGSPVDWGTGAMVRNVAGAVGVTALAATFIDARFSWLPMFAYGGAALALGPRRPGGTEALWHWLMQPGPQTGAWTTALGALAAGTAVYAVAGPRRTSAGR
jgi:hypothetical protein